jgi:hypothetical protein
MIQLKPMTYRESYHNLFMLHDANVKDIQLRNNNIEIHNCTFKSEYWTMLPGAQTYRCPEHELEFHEDLEFGNRDRMQLYPETLKHGDIDIQENKDFTYLLFKKANPARSNEVIFLFHGLNEHSWHKYLPWAETLVSRTGKAVILFPIAFHMNRTPVEWGKPRSMNIVSGIRRSHSPALMNSSFANAAISARIEMIPQRFFWSGLQTFDDVVRLATNIKKGTHPFIAPDAHIDLFAYSIGSFLGEILMMANPNNYFQDSKMFMFCGGPTLDRMSPNSKFILDSDATIAIYSFYTERLDAELHLDYRIAHYFSEAHPAGLVFKMMLSYQKNKQAREQRFRELQNQLCAVALKKDDVIPANEVLNTLKGDYRDIDTHVEVMDFPFPYTHINPFPLDKEIEKLVDQNYNKVFEVASSHLC